MVLVISAGAVGEAPGAHWPASFLDKFQVCERTRLKKRKVGSFLGTTPKSSDTINAHMCMSTNTRMYTHTIKPMY